MEKTKKALASLVIAGMALAMLPFNAFATGAVPTGLAGTTAEQTAVEIANQTGWTGTAILASSAAYGMVDALTAGPLASYLKAPILLTGAGNVLDPATKAELVKLAVTKVYVTSGTAVISQAVLDELVAMKITVIPLGGVDRSDTSVNIAKKMVGVTKVAVANGLQDALSIAAIASAANQPILLTDKDALPASVIAYLAANPGITASDVIGGTGIISDVVKAAVPSATRHASNTAYDTNNQVIQDFAASLMFDRVYLANGVTGIDALSGAPLAAMTKSAIVLTDGTVPAVAEFVNGKLTSNSVVTALGGAVVVPASVLAGVVYKAPYKAPVVSEVTTVSAITITGVEVVLPTVTKAKAAYTIEVKDPAGTVVPVKPINLEVGDAAVSFEFVTPLTSVTVGNWTIGGVTLDLGGQTAVQPALDARVVNFEDLGSIITKNNLEVRIKENDQLESNVGLAKLKRDIKDKKERIEDINDERGNATETSLIIALGAEKRALLEDIKRLERALEDMPITVNTTAIDASISDAQQIRLAEGAFIMHAKLGIAFTDLSMSIDTLQNQLTVMQQREALGVVDHNQVDELTTKLMDTKTQLESTKLQQESTARQLEDLLNDQDHSIVIGSIPATDAGFIIKDEAADLKKALENSYMIKLQKEQHINLEATLARAEKDHGLSSDEYSRAELQLSNADLALSQQEDKVNSDYANIIDDIAKKQSNLQLEEQKLEDKRVALSEAQLKLSLGLIIKLEVDSARTDLSIQADTIKTQQIDLFSSINGYNWLLKGMPLTS